VSRPVITGLDWQGVACTVSPTKAQTVGRQQISFGCRQEPVTQRGAEEALRNLAVHSDDSEDGDVRVRRDGVRAAFAGLGCTKFDAVLDSLS
jgi:hypothetical protein